MSSVDNDESDGSKLAVWIIGVVLIGSLLIAGLFPILIAFGIIPVDSSKIHAPRWVLAVAGSVFLGAGLYTLQLALSQREDMRWSHLASAAMQTAIATIAGWVAFGAGPRQFWHTEQILFVSTQTPASELLGRTMFGVGFLLAGALALNAWRKFFKSLRREQ